MAIRSANFSIVSLLVNNLNGHPDKFESLPPADQELVRKLAGDYPKGWDPEQRRFVSEPTRGPKGDERTSSEWRQEAERAFSANPARRAARGATKNGH